MLRIRLLFTLVLQLLMVYLNAATTAAVLLLMFRIMLLFDFVLQLRLMCMFMLIALLM